MRRSASIALTFPLHPRRLVAGPAFGAMRARTRGAGVDLVGSRPYQPGDDVRRIDWHVSARISSLRGSDEFVVREYLRDEATQVRIVVDRSPSMALCPPELPWLAKPDASREAATLIRDSALAAACVVRELEDDRTDGSIDAVLGALLDGGHAVPPGSMLFLLSDFLTRPGERWHTAAARGWDLIPVVMQDPLWERTFPAVAGALLPLVDPATGRTRVTRLSTAEVEARRQANERRFEALLEDFHGLGVDPVVLASSDHGHIFEAFLDWAYGRHQGARIAR